MMRSLAFDFKNDEKVHSIPDQYMFGSAFLVNPVTERMYSLTANIPAEKTRKVYLPKSTAWVDFWTGQTIEGGQTVEAQAPIETIPLYVRAGSIVPMGGFLQYATEKPADVIELRIYPGADGEFVLYEDENDNYNYEQGKYATIRFTWSDKTRTLDISDQNGSFNGMLKERKFNIVLVNPENGTGVGITATIDKSVQYTGKHIHVKL